ncbi:MAG: riboflavin biosynthesis protein RibD [Bacteroidetes bacterium GWE2_41_25]|nr:MAG: riboflavin biosynthesis protein RibD [Bacteroidetes bacterium GWA2_40_15]OFX85319.1 MAG: riboflavin biosynthesis protein RibD [Bacteroidetes bacterium GWC2_40_22]OFX90918.1 MAG: riboflavin biosynthesis protein RibD [Bacteroidetes bacterium GWE2_41_25]OFY59311.1 MAG: riboflavin biosynthesis protein RibD [Bacteroidetes bacterium GWF2_41_9]HAM11180.1 bifunctional diaminohydroxyphosphoribosylaminopyrimidine deaminase/5-amino-6-(5-phosphoribosylamino)uracil reductase RibD [Bacteroidales bact
MVEREDIKFMQRCLELAAKAEGLTYPNPMVGAVIVHEGKIIGEGFHLKAGTPHAEVNAINSVSDKSLLTSSTLYVNLEPCSHFGKTPPCADMIISNSVPRVVIGTTDTSERVSGKGIARLKSSGCEVKTGILEDECRRLNRRFFTVMEKKRPYIILKWAQSTDGYIDIMRGSDNCRPAWITGKPEKVLVHKWRSCEQAILVGAGTVRADNPQLNVREWTGNHPLRVILSRSGAVGQNSVLFRTKGTIFVFTGNMNSDLPGTMKIRLKEGMTASEQIVSYLYSEGIQSLFIEGGAEVLNHFISEGYWDEARVFTGEGSFGDGVKAPELANERLTECMLYSKSKLDIFIRKGSELS